MSRRDQIRLSDDEVKEFLAGARTVIICSNGRDGFPHPMPMWYAVEEDGAIVMTTFAKSQKVKNLRRDPRVALLVESGETYAELKGVVVYGTAAIEEDTDAVLDVLERIAAKEGTAPPNADPEAVREALRVTARKRVAIRIPPEKVVSWDHAKLGGRY